MDAERGRRLLRSAVLGTVLLALTLGGHATAAGMLPDALGLLLALGLAILLAHAVSARSLSLPRLVAFLLGAQALLHVVLTVTHSHVAHGQAPSALAMVLGHALAACVAAIVVSRADSLAGRWSAYLASAISAWRLAPVAVPARGVTAPRSLMASTPRLESLQHQVARRGPPRPTLLATA